MPWMMAVSMGSERDRPTRKDSLGVTHWCPDCQNAFVGEEWHAFCLVCIEQIAADIAAKQGAL